MRDYLKGALAGLSDNTLLAAIVSGIAVLVLLVAIIPAGNGSTVREASQVEALSREVAEIAAELEGLQESLDSIAELAHPQTVRCN